MATVAARDALAGDAALLVDETFKDHSVVNAGASFTKTWRFQNTGDTVWTGFTLVYVSGEPMGGPAFVAITDGVQPGGIVDVSVDLAALPAPTCGAKGHAATWQIKNAGGVGVSGGLVTVVITVNPPAGALYPDLASAGYGADINPYAAGGYGGQCTGFAYGRMYERLGAAGVSELPRNHAKFWHDLTKFGKGMLPANNSVAVWSNAGDGHVAFVESVSGDLVTFSEANWTCYEPVTDQNWWGGGYDEEPKTRTAAEMYTHPAGTLLGYIYPGATYLDEDPPFDGEPKAGGAVFSKTWYLQNSWNLTWTSASYSARLLDGSTFGPSSISLSGDVAPGGGATITTSLTAPLSIGTYLAKYQMYGPSGFFGAPFWLEIEVTSSAVAPDLVVDRVYVVNGAGTQVTSMQTGQTYVIHSWVKNVGVGSVAAGAFLDEIEISGVRLCYNSNPIALATNQEYDRYCTYTAGAAGTATVTGRADYGGAITEASDANNATSISVPITSNPPDLTVNRLYVTSGTTTVTSLEIGKTYTIHSWVRNIGTGSVAAGAFWDDITINDVRLCYNTSPVALSTNQEYDRYCLYTPQAAGTISIKGRADYTGSVAESNESNNIYAASYTVANYPALTVTTPASATVCAGSYNTFTTTAGGGNGSYSYQWYEWNCTGSCSWKLVGANSRTYSTNLVRTYFVRVTSGSQSASSAYFTLSNYPAVTITTPASARVLPGRYHTFTTTASGGNGSYTYRWYEWNCTGSCSWKQVGTNSRTYTTNLVRTYYVTATSCSQTATSGWFTLSN